MKHKHILREPLIWHKGDCARGDGDHVTTRSSSAAGPVTRDDPVPEPSKAARGDLTRVHPAQTIDFTEKKVERSSYHQMKDSSQRLTMHVLQFPEKEKLIAELCPKPDNKEEFQSLSQEAKNIIKKQGNLEAHELNALRVLTF